MGNIYGKTTHLGANTFGKAITQEAIKAPDQTIPTVFMLCNTQIKNQVIGFVFVASDLPEGYHPVQQQNQKNLSI